MAYGGAAVSWSLDVHAAYASPAADARREAELDRLAALIAQGGSVDLRCGPACELRRRLVPTAPCHVVGIAAALRARAVSKLAADPLQPRAELLPVVLPREGSFAPIRSVRFGGQLLHVRRACPPPFEWSADSRAVCSPRLSAALEQHDLLPQSFADPVALVVRSQPLAFAGAGDLVVAASEAPSAFSHRRLERRPDAECIVLPFPACNVPPVAPVEIPPPADPPADLVAHDLSEIIPHDDLRKYSSWARRADRSIALAREGHSRSARQARPDDLVLRRTQPRFAGVVMDFSVHPFRPLLPSRWPDRPPSTDIRIRHARREFRAYPDYGDRQLRGFWSHGVPEIGPCSLVSHFAAPHGSAYQHSEQWRRQMQQELDAGWGQAGFDRSLGLATWPQRCQPTSMVERNGSWRLCHDMSWPPDSEEVESPNAADVLVMIVMFVGLNQLALVAAIYLAGGLPVKVCFFDLKKAYKRGGQQNASRWRRTCWSESRSQTLDRTCFGQTDGPSSFSRSTTMMVFVMRRELRFADRSYPTRDESVVAFLRMRRLMVPSRACGELQGETVSSALAFVAAMIDDFGLVTVDDVLFRADGSPVIGPDGVQCTRSWLSFNVCLSVVLRFGHLLEPDNVAKFWLPNDYMLYLGTTIDLVSEELVFDSTGEHCKRERYTARLAQMLSDGGASPKSLTSVAFKMLVVCECYPFGRQWLAPIFRALRGGRTSRVGFSVELEVAQSLRLFHDLLASDQRLAVPLASRHSFPFADSEHLLVDFADASGLSRPGEVAEGEPGYGAWTVRRRVLYIVHGLWTRAELDVLSISVLEFLISYWADVIFSEREPQVSHLLGFSDNSGAEWSMRRETPAAELMQRVSARRSAYLQQHGLYSRVSRVATSENHWADWLSRQRVAEVLREAAALGLAVVHLQVPPGLRDTHWLTHP